MRLMEDRDGSRPMFRPQKEPKSRGKRGWHSVYQPETWIAAQRMEPRDYQILSKHPLCRFPAVAVGLAYQFPLLVSRPSEGRVEGDGGRDRSVELSGRGFRSGAPVREYSKIRASLICRPRIECYLPILRGLLRHSLRHRSFQQVIVLARRFHRSSFEIACGVHGGFEPLVGWPRLQRLWRRSQLQRRGFDNGLCLQTSFCHTAWCVPGDTA